MAGVVRGFAIVSARAVPLGLPDIGWANCPVDEAERMASWNRLLRSDSGSPTLA